MAIINENRIFQQLLGEQPVLTGIVDSHNSDGTSTLSMTGGGSVRVTGQTVAIGSLAQIQGQTLLGEAANLAAFNLEV